MESHQPTDTQDDKVESCIRDQLGATHVQRQGRWRPMWLVDATIDGKRRELMVRGDRSGAVLGFPLRHEMLVQSFLHQRGIMVPAVHGWIEDVTACVMDRIPGRVDFVGVDESQRDTVMRDYMAIFGSDPPPSRRSCRRGRDQPLSGLGAHGRRGTRRIRTGLCRGGYRRLHRSCLLLVPESGDDVGATSRCTATLSPIARSG